MPGLNAAIQHIGYVPQRHLIDADTTLESLELVRLGFSGNRWGLNPFSRNDRTAAFDALKSVGAEEFAHRSLGGCLAGNYSGYFSLKHW